jgi:hypothetical protein
MRGTRASPLTHAGSACVQTSSWNTNVRGIPTRQEPNA